MIELFARCLKAKYVHTENDGDFAIEREGGTLFIYFQCSNSKEDWKNNFDFPVKPYKDMGITWYCHRGFHRVWKSIEDYMAEVIEDYSIKRIYIVGYSHGGAIATLCHEYIWYHRPDLRGKIEGYGFGSPRCLWGIMSKELKERWTDFHIIRNGNDLVTHLPPVIFGYRHITKNIVRMKRGVQEEYTKIAAVNDHYPYNYILGLSHLENGVADGR